MPDSSRIAFLLNKGVDEKRKGNYQRSIELYTEALRLDPLNPVCYGNFGKIYYLTGQFQLSCIAYLKSVHIKIIINNGGKTNFLSIVGVDIPRHLAHSAMDSKNISTNSSAAHAIEQYRLGLTGQGGFEDELFEATRERSGIIILRNSIVWDKINMPSQIIRDIVIYDSQGVIGEIK